MEEAKAAADKLAQGTTFEALAAERGLKDSRHRSRHGGEDRRGRSRRRRRRVRAQVRRGQRAGPGPVRHRHRQGRCHRGRPDPAVRGGGRRAQARHRRTSAPRTKSPTCRKRSRTSGSAARRSPTRRASSISQPRVIEAIDRNGKDAQGNAIPDLPQNVDVLSAAFARRRPRRKRAAAGAQQRRLCLVRRRGDHAGARPPARRGQGPGRGALARRRDRRRGSRTKATEMLDKIKAGTSFADVAAADKLKVEWRPGIKRGGPPPGLSPAAVTEVFKTPQDSRRQRRRREPDRADRVSRDRDQGAAARSGGRRRQASRRGAAQRASPRT